MITYFQSRAARLKATRATSVAALAVRPAPIENDEEQRYKPIEMKLVWRLLTWLKPFKKQIMLGISIGLVHVLLDLTGPTFIGRIINYTTAYQAKQIRVSEGYAIRHVMWIIAFWSCAFVGSVLLQRWCIIIMTRAGENVQFKLRRAMFEHLQTLSMSYYDRTKLGRIISRLTSDVNSMREVNVWGIWQIVNNGMIIIVSGSMLCYINWRLFLAVVWLGPVLYVVNRVFLKKIGRAHQISREGWTRVSTNLAENITGMRVVTAFNRQDPNLAVFNRLQEDNTLNNVRVGRINGLYQPTLMIIGFIGRAIILLYGAYLISNGTIKAKEGIGSVVMAYLYWDWFMNPIVALGNFYNTIMMAMAGAERVFNLLDTKPDVHDLENARPLPRIIGNVKFENVTFGYSADRPVLHEINFEAPAGQTYALVGATGSGKSSIVSLIARFYQPQLGRVLVDGYDIRYINGESLHKQTGLVLQVNYLFTGTVMENIRYARDGATDDDVINAATAIGSHDTIMSLQKGYETEVGERGANMSLGQRQLICFTRAFLADPRIFMLDEATSAVDTATEMLVQTSLEKLLLGRTTFIVAHRLSTIMKADCILVIDQGRIIERGTHRELVAAGGKYAHLYEQFAQRAA